MGVVAISTEGRFFRSERAVIVNAHGTLADRKTEMTRYRNSRTVLVESGKPVIIPDSVHKPGDERPLSNGPGYLCLPDTVNPRGPKEIGEATPGVVRAGRRSADEVYRRRTEHAGLPHHRLQVFARRPGARPGHVGDVE